MTDLRDALRYELDQRGFEVLAFEETSFPISGDKDALEECLATVRQADHYILLIGNSAGRVQDGTSPTREEYRAAKASFLVAGKPKLILCVRAATRDSADRMRRGLQAPELDDASFIIDFIAEVEVGATAGEPNWLHRFRDFRGLMEILATRLRWGRNHQETLAKKAVLDEVLANLANMTSRRGESAFPHHWWGQKARDEIQLTHDMLGRQFRVSRDVANSLGACFVAGHLDALSTVAMERVMLEGVLLEYSVAEQRLVAGDLHVAIRACIQDIRSARSVLQPSNDWRLKLMGAAANANRGDASVMVSTEDVLWALAYVDRAENAFESQVQLARFLLTGDGSPVPTSARRPASPLEGASESIWREKVEPSEVEHLVIKGIHPFGSRMPAGLLHDERLKEVARELAERNLPMFEALADSVLGEARPTRSEMEGILEQVSLKVIQSNTALPGEGIEKREKE